MPDPNAVANVNNARQAGMSYVDVYMFPCPTCSLSASGQVRDMGKKMLDTSYGVYGMIWWQSEMPIILLFTLSEQPGIQ